MIHPADPGGRADRQQHRHYSKERFQSSFSSSTSTTTFVITAALLFGRFGSCVDEVTLAVLVSVEPRSQLPSRALELTKQRFLY
jgi:hypothetical protein